MRFIFSLIISFFLFFMEGVCLSSAPGENPFAFMRDLNLILLLTGELPEKNYIINHRNLIGYWREKGGQSDFLYCVEDKKGKMFFEKKIKITKMGISVLEIGWIFEINNELYLYAINQYTNLATAKLYRLNFNDNYLFFKKLDIKKMLLKIEHDDHNYIYNDGQTTISYNLLIKLLESSELKFDDDIILEKTTATCK